MVLERLAGELEPDRVVDLIESGAEPLRDFIAALHSKLLVEELKRHRERGASEPWGSCAYHQASCSSITP